MGSTQPAKLKSYHYSNLEGAVVLITGASSGLGRELALMLCPLQLRLLITGRDKTRLDETVTMCNERGNS